MTNTDQPHMTPRFIEVMDLNARFCDAIGMGRTVEAKRIHEQILALSA